nr:MAG TPA_asm: hypothetical protein [Caudoviricetes sp.]
MENANFAITSPPSLLYFKKNYLGKFFNFHYLTNIL